MSDESLTSQDTANEDTAPKNEGAKPRKRTTRSQQPEVFLYESREREPATFTIAGVVPERSFADGRLIFKVKQAQLPAFQSHYHVVTGRVVRKHADA